MQARQHQGNGEAIGLLAELTAKFRLRWQLRHGGLRVSLVSKPGSSRVWLEEGRLQVKTGSFDLRLPLSGRGTVSLEQVGGAPHVLSFVWDESETMLSLGPHKLPPESLEAYTALVTNKDISGDIPANAHVPTSMAQPAIRRDNRKTRLLETFRAGTYAPVLPDVRAILEQIDRKPLATGVPLSAYEHQIFSQHGEDGITYELLKRAGMATRKCIEIGCGHNGGNAGFLLAGLDYKGLLIDGSGELVGMARQLFADTGANVVQAFVTRETVNELLESHDMSGEVDYLGIDIDGVDFWIWDAITCVSPRLVIVEYTAPLGPDLSITVPYSPDFDRHQHKANGILAKFYYGASLSALNKLATRKGYRLVCASSAGSNAYFLRNDVALETPAVPVKKAWRPPTKAKYTTAVSSKAMADPLRHFAEHGVPIVTIE